MAGKTTNVDPTLKRVLLEIDEIAKLGVISNTLRVMARKIAEKEWRNWTGMKHSEMVDHAIDLARASRGQRLKTGGKQRGK